MTWLSVNFDFVKQNLLFTRKFYFQSPLFIGGINVGIKY